MAKEKIKKRICDFCGKKTELVRKDPPTCKKCYSKQYSRRKDFCSKCGKFKEIHCKGICDLCYRKVYNQPTKTCIKCEKIKKIKYNTKGGPICNSCYKSPKEKCSICGINKSVWYRENGNIFCSNCYQKHKRKTDDNLRVLHLLRSRLGSAINEYSKNGKIKRADEYGVSYSDIITHLKPFPEDIENYHIDHIIPLCAFDFNNPNQIKAAFAPENHQWLLKGENLSKNGKYNEEDLTNYLERFYEKDK